MEKIKNPATTKLKYRRLTDKELTQLERKFVDFLILNGIVADEWARMKTQEPKKALQMVDIFSNMVFETTLKKIEYLRHISPSDLCNVRVTDNNVEIIGLNATTPKVDLTNPKHINKIFDGDEATLEYIVIYKAESKHKVSRERTVFELMESGYLVCDDQFFNYLKALRP